MPGFRNVVEDFNATLEALRDFVACAGPVLAQREEQTTNDAKKLAGRFHFARLLADENAETSYLSEEEKKLVVELRKILTGLDSNASPEKLSKVRDTIRKVIPIKIADGKIELDVDDPQAPELLARHKAVLKLKKEIGLLRESALMALTSRSEWFVAQLIHLFFHMHPEAAGMSEPFFSLDTLASLQTIDDARDVLLDHKVESIMRMSFEDWLGFFKDKPKLGLHYLDADKNRLAEIFKRRNLIVHNGGRVSRKYLKEVDANLCAALKPGDEVEITPDYLSAAIDLIEHQFVLIAAELWKKLEPADQSRGNLLTNLAVQCLNERRWAMARGFSFFAMNDKNLVEATRLSAQINYWQSFKWAGQYDEIRSEVESADLSAKSPLFQLAHAALTDNFESVFKLLPRMLDSEELTKNQLATWPLFQTVRLQPNFVAHYAVDSGQAIDGKIEPATNGPSSSGSIEVIG